MQAAMTAPRSVSPYWRQLRDERCYRGKWADQPRGSRYVLVSGYEERDLCRGRKGGISLSSLYAELGRKEYQRG